MARSNIWQMLKIVLTYSKYPLWGDDNCTPKINDKCKKTHRHSGSTGNFAISSLQGLEEGPILYDSQLA